jgi:hypothetical protein
MAATSEDSVGSVPRKSNNSQLERASVVWDTLREDRAGQAFHAGMERHKRLGCFIEFSSRARDMTVRIVWI